MSASVFDVVEALIENDEELIRNWKKFYISLGLDPAESIPLDFGFKTGTEPVWNIFYQIINLWVSKSGDSATVRQLNHFLRASDFNIAADQLLRKFNIQKNPDNDHYDKNEKGDLIIRPMVLPLLSNNAAREAQAPCTSKASSPQAKKQGDTDNNQMDLDSQTINETIWFEVGRLTKNFIGRSKEIEFLSQMFHRAATARVTITGMGGLGKSALAKQQAKALFDQHHVHCIWLNGESSDSFRNSILRLAELSAISVVTTHTIRGQQQTRPTMDVINDLIHILPKRGNRTFLIIDNVDELTEHVEHLLMTADTSPFFVVVTSRNKAVLEGRGEIISLEVLERPDAISLVENLTVNQTPENIERLCQLLQDFPLALQQAGAFIKNQQLRGFKGKYYSILDYLNDYDDQRQQSKLLNFPLSKFDGHEYKETTFVTWNVSIEKVQTLGEVGKVAITLLNNLAYFEADGINIDLLWRISCVSDTNVESHFDDALKLLIDYSFVGLEDYNISIHRLVQDVIRIKISSTDSEFQILRELLLSSVMIEKTLKPGDMIHILSSWRHAMHKSELIKEFKTFLITLSAKLGTMGLHSEMLDFSSQSEQRLKEYFGSGDLETLRMGHQIADALFYKGEFDHAISLYTKEHQRLRSTFEDDNIETIQIAEKIGLSLELLERLEESLIWFNVQLEFYTKTEDQETTTAVHHKMAEVMMKDGKHKEALKHLEIAFEWRKGQLGEEDFKTLSISYAIGECLFALAEFQNAKERLERVLQLNVKVLGNEHDLTWKTQLMLAKALDNLGEVSKAIDFLRELLTSQEKLLGKDHLQSINTNLELATLLSHQEKLEEPMATTSEDALKVEKLHEIPMRTPTTIQYVLVSDVMAVLILESELLKAWKILLHPLGLVESEIVDLGEEGKSEGWLAEMISTWASKLGGKATITKLMDVLKRDGFDIAVDALSMKYVSTIEPASEKDLATSLIQSRIVGSLPHIINSVVTPWVMQFNNDPNYHDICSRVDFAIEKMNQCSISAERLRKFVITFLVLIGYCGKKICSLFLIRFCRFLQKDVIFDKNSFELIFGSFLNTGVLLQEIGDTSNVDVIVDLADIITKGYLRHPCVILMIKEVAGIEEDINEISILRWLFKNIIKLEKTSFYAHTLLEKLIKYDCLVIEFKSEIAGLCYNTSMISQTVLSVYVRLFGKYDDWVLKSIIGDKNEKTLEAMYEIGKILRTLDKKELLDIYHLILTTPDFKQFGFKFTSNEVKRPFVKLTEELARTEPVPSFIESLKKELIISTQRFGNDDECTLDILTELTEQCWDLRMYEEIREIWKVLYKRHKNTFRRFWGSTPKPTKYNFLSQVPIFAGMTSEEIESRREIYKLCYWCDGSCTTMNINHRYSGQYDKRCRLHLVHKNDIFKQIRLVCEDDRVNRDEKNEEVKQAIVRGIEKNGRTRTQGDYFQSLQKQCQISLERFGADDDCTFHFRSQLALHYEGLWKADQSGEIMKDSYLRRKAKFGKVHQITLKDGKRAADNFSAAGLHAQEIDIRREIFKDFEREFGGKDLRTQERKFEFAIALAKSHRERALDLLLQILDTQMQIESTEDDGSIKRVKGQTVFSKLDKIRHGCSLPFKTEKKIEPLETSFVEEMGEKVDFTVKIQVQIDNILQRGGVDLENAEVLGYRIGRKQFQSPAVPFDIQHLRSLEKKYEVAIKLETRDIDKVKLIPDKDFLKQIGYKLLKILSKLGLFGHSGHIWRIFYDLSKVKYGSTHWLTLWIGDKAADFFMKVSMASEAIKVRKEIAENCVEVLGVRDCVTLIKKYELANVLEESDNDEALSIYEHILPVWVEAYGAGHSLTTKIKRNIIRLEQQISKTGHEKSELNHLQKQLQLSHKRFGEDDELSFDFHKQLGKHLKGLGMLLECAHIWSRLYDLKKMKYGKVDSKTIKAGQKAAKYFLKIGRLLEEIVIRRDLADNSHELLGDRDPYTQVRKFELAVALEGIDRNEAIRIYEHIHPICIELWGQHNHWTEYVTRNVGRLKGIKDDDLD